MSGWRPALRIARRSVRRNRGRSLLVAVLVGLPVAGGTTVEILARTLSANEREARRAMGPADAQATVTAGSRLEGYRPAAHGGVETPDTPAGRDRDPATVDLAGLLPRGSRIAPVPVRGVVRVRSGPRILRAELVVADPGEPLHADEAVLDAGRLPARPDEVLLSPALAERLGGLRPGATIAPVDGPPLKVAGLAHARFCLSCEQLVAAPGSAGARLAPDEPNRVEDPVDYRVDLPDGEAATALWPALAERGVALVPRDAYLHPDRYASTGDGVTVDTLRGAALGVLIAGLGLLEIVLLAGTAFAVGARRQTRELGLVAAAGGTARDVRRIVLAQGLVLGALGALLGVAAGAVLAVAARPLWERFDDAEILAWAFGPWEIGAAALVGLLSGLAAAVLPALGDTRALASEATANQASAPDSSAALALIVGGATVLVAGLLILAPAMIDRLASVAARLPLSPRLAFRDAARHRHRTGPATGAIAMAVAGSVVLAFVVAGTFEAEARRHVPALPPHVLSVEPGDADMVAATRGAQAAAAGCRAPGCT